MLDQELVTLGVQMMYNKEKDVVMLVLSYVATHAKIQILYIIPLKVIFVITQKHSLM
jgi:hypothetical protein